MKKINFKPEPGQSKCICKKFFNNDLIKNISDNFESWKIFSKKFFSELKNFYISKSIEQLKISDIEHKGSKIYHNDNHYILEIKNMNKWYSNKMNKTYQQILFNVNLKVKEGEFVVILGESGSGKTTLLNIIAGIERATNGDVIIHHNNLITMNENELTKFRKKYISIIFQNYSLIQTLNVKENVEVGSELQDDARRRIDIDLMIEKLNIKNQKYKFPKQLSGGQQQRVAIAKTLSKNSKILLADEPTGAVDENTCKNILNMFLEIQKKYKTTIILITHNYLISYIANKVVKIADGRVLSITIQKPKNVEDINWVLEK